MRLNQIFCYRVYMQCRFCTYNQFIYLQLTNLTPYCQGYKLNRSVSRLSLVKEVMCKFSYSTNTTATSKKSDGSEKAEPSKPKKKKEIKVYITLTESNGSIISVTTIEDAMKLASRRNMRLVKVMDLDPKTGRAEYKLMSESEYLKGDWEESKSKKGKEKSIKGDKVVSLSSSTAEHDILTKVKMMKNWLEKRFEVRVVITGDPKNGENVFKTIEKEIEADGRIVQKRVKGQDIRFQILPPKRIEGTKTVKEET